MIALQDQLDEITANTRELVPEERLAVSEKAIVSLFASGIEERILPVGAEAPKFELESDSGHWVRSADLLALGPLVVNFFRGRWCPYCTTELEVWRDLHAQVRAAGGFLVSVCPQTVRQNDFMVNELRLPYPVLRDPGCALAERLGLVYEVPERLRGYHRAILINIPFINGEESWRLPLPATYVIGRDGKVRFAEGHADYRVRPEPSEVLEALR